MQLVMLVLSSEGPSLRRQICDGLKGKDRGFLGRQWTVSHLKRKRTKGWAKITAKKVFGACNFDWNSSTRTLTARFITEKGHTPYELAGLFSNYLMTHLSSRLVSITIIPPKRKRAAT